MKLKFFQILVCVAALGGMLYSYLDTQNALALCRMRLPALVKEVAVISEENTRLSYDIERFEDPKNLMQLAKQKTYRHLKQPSQDLVMSIELSDQELHQIRLAKAP
ncbi:MAG: hypothetical protein H7A40_00350 [Chlamydiales bacterium]|nr:hypothetical protein [Chlamydiales bacterium]